MYLSQSYNLLIRTEHTTAAIPKIIPSGKTSPMPDSFSVSSRYPHAAGNNFPSFSSIPGSRLDGNMIPDSRIDGRNAA